MIKQLKNSDNDPINVDLFTPEVVNFKGKIGMTLAPGKKNFGMHLDPTFRTTKCSIKHRRQETGDRRQETIIVVNRSK